MNNKIFIAAGIAGAIAVSVCTGFKAGNSGEEKYRDSGTFTRKTETVTYDHKTTESYNMPSGVPAYVASDATSGCANIAGAIIIGYYDRFCEQLIPDYSAYTQLGSAIIYKSGTSSQVSAVISSLYSLMGTDVGGSGTTFSGFSSGMASYAGNSGYTYSSASVLSGGSFDLSQYSSALSDGKPVALFLSRYSFAVSVTADGNTDQIEYDYSAVAHVVVGYGYRTDTYYDANGNITATRTYLHVAGGIAGYSTCYLCLDGKSTLDSAVSALIQ